MRQHALAPPNAQLFNNLTQQLAWFGHLALLVQGVLFRSLSAFQLS
jgi:hypothetical protein